jgi:phosphohistidine phosphatase SixA
MTRLVLAALVLLATIAPAAADRGSDAAWSALVEGGHVALIRHGNAPPVGGDPPGFRLDDCETQRNLDDVGRRQAVALGEALRQRGVRVDRILSSPWCRCRDTARLMEMGEAETSWALVPDQNPNMPVRLRELRELVSGWRGPGTLVLVTHALTIRPLAGYLPDQAEIVVFKPMPGAEPRLVGSIAPPR